MNDDELRNVISQTLTCRVDQRCTSMLIFFWVVPAQNLFIYLLVFCGLAERIVPIKWNNFLRDAITILVSMIPRCILLN